MNALGLVFLVVGLVVGVVYSIRERKFLLQWRSVAKSSPLSQAIGQLVGTAGGIYLSLQLLVDFLKISEDWWNPSDFFLEPLALISLMMAIIQPFAVKIFLKLRK